MHRIEMVDSGVVYRDDKPHLRSRHAYFPSIVQTGAGELTCALDIGSAFEATDVCSYVCRSSDGGRSWSKPKLIFDPPPATSTTCRIQATEDGTLIGLVSLMDRRRAEEGLANPATDGFVRTQWALVRSSDAGRTWSSPELFNAPLDWHAFEACSPILITPTGRWLAPTAIWPDWDGRNPLGSKAIAMISDDRGQTWTRAVDVMDEWRNRVGHYEQKQVVLSDGRLLAVCWVINHETKQNRRNRYALSNDDAENYIEPRETPLHGETCTPIALPGNHVLCVYRRTDKRGLWAHLAQIEGAQWTPLEDLPLWGANVIARDTTQASLLAQMSTLRFGCPSLTMLNDDEVLAVFWCIEDCVSNIRWIRLRIA